jgi:hypothetical protein
MTAIFQIPNLDTFDAIESAAKSRRVELTDAMFAYLENESDDDDDEVIIAIDESDYHDDDDI